MRSLATFFALPAALALAACSAGADGPAAAPPAPPATAMVDIAGYAFSPKTITVPAGTVVTWTERDDDIEGTGAHNVVADDGSFSSDPNMAKGAAYSTKPPRPGTYAYHCGIHNYMTGTVVVT